MNITANGVSPYLLLDSFGYTGGVDRLIQVNLVADGAKETGESVAPLLSLVFGEFVCCSLTSLATFEIIFMLLLELRGE